MHSEGNYPCGLSQTRKIQQVGRWQSHTSATFFMELQPVATVRELENYSVDLSDLTVMELEIVPDKSGGGAWASLESLRLA